MLVHVVPSLTNVQPILAPEKMSMPLFDVDTNKIPVSLSKKGMHVDCLFATSNMNKLPQAI